MIAPSGTDSILGIASGICGAAVAGALASSTSLPRSQTPLSPALTDGAADPMPSGGLPVGSPMPGVPAEVQEYTGGAKTSRTPVESGADIALSTVALLPTPPDAARPSLRHSTTPPAATPRDTALHPISSTSFRVTDSCADRVWRMLQGATGGDDAAVPPSMTPMAEEALNEGGGYQGTVADGLQDLVTVPEFPSLDEAAYAQLEREALQGPDSAAVELPVHPNIDRGPSERPSTPPAPPKLDVQEGGAATQPWPGDSPSLQPTFCDSPGVPARRSSRRSASASHKMPSDHVVPAAAQRDDELRQTAITDTLVNQSLSASVMFPGANAGSFAGDEILLESMLDGDSVEPDALPSPTQPKPRKSLCDPTPAHRSSGRCSSSRNTPLHKAATGSRVGPSRRTSTGSGADRSCPATSTFDAAAIVSNVCPRAPERSDLTETYLERLCCGISGSVCQVDLCLVCSQRGGVHSARQGLSGPRLPGLAPQLCLSLVPLPPVPPPPAGCLLVGHRRHLRRCHH